jgi:hypothetical protein
MDAFEQLLRSLIVERFGRPSPQSPQPSATPVDRPPGQPPSTAAAQTRPQTGAR